MFPSSLFDDHNQLFGYLHRIPEATKCANCKGEGKVYAEGAPPKGECEPIFRKMTCPKCGGHGIDIKSLARREDYDHDELIALRRIVREIQESRSWGDEGDDWEWEYYWDGEE